jgi:hypothetical protein
MGCLLEPDRRRNSRWTTGSHSTPPFSPASLSCAAHVFQFEFVIGLMADGWSETDILADYPGLTREDITACLAYARDILRSETVYPSAA